MGSHQEPGSLRFFDVVVGVANDRPIKPEDHPHAIVHHYSIKDDGPPTPEERALVRAAALQIHKHLDEGRRVFVSCRSGFNRSGWVICETLMLRGLTGPEAIKRAREGRTYAVLNNEFFEHIVRNT